MARWPSFLQRLQLARPTPANVEKSLVEFSVETFRTDLRVPSSTDGQTLRLPSEAGITDAGIETSTLGTVLTFVGGDLLGILLLYGGLQFFTEFVALQLPTAPLSFLGLLSVAALVSFGLTGLYRARFTHPALEMKRMAAVTGTIGGSAALTIFLLTSTVRPPLLVAAGALAAMLILPCSRVLTRIVCSRLSWWGIPAVVIAGGESREAILTTLRRWPEIGLRPVAVLGDSELEIPDDIPITGRSELAPRLAHRFNIPYLLLAVPARDHAERAKLQLRYAKFFDHVVELGTQPHLPALWTTSASGDGLFGYSIRHASLRPGARFTKRLLDVLGAAAIAVVSLPLQILIALFIRFDSRGGVFYRQQRMGREGRVFTVLKYRTMYENADEMLTKILEEEPELRREYEQYHKLENDPRVTRVGRFLRRYSLDELPQIYNVLRGDMSLVGPRAYMPSELPKMNRMARAVLQAPPGITGLWQVSGRNNLSFSERVDLDIHYIQNWSLWLDLYLLIRTLPAVISGNGAS